MSERDPSVVDDLGTPDRPGLPLEVGADTDEDGVADTLALLDGPDLLLHMDVDGDGLSDDVLALGVDDLPGIEPRGRWWSWLWPW
ncbi:hypothetical protein [Pseudonocardia sp. N23]|uniref:hypothetical protein n=1 Tax=Pseudonocardia sp. N23 TaxID=1987376 RepID=UPI000C022F75|nr:hypothetical protein [Pseudonocardia sp. N23]GAY11115.1 hypothetical protein TOK_5601 [Pseudonocardia sp. N23]